MGFTPGSNDPFIELMRPPPDETPAQATARLQREQDAQRVSDRIDEELKAERARKKKEDRNIVRILLLGQSESGKSTTLKNFRMRYAKDDWERERDGWRAVVQLNIVRSIITILKVVEAELNGGATSESGHDADDALSEMTAVNADSPVTLTGSQIKSQGDAGSSDDEEDNQGQPVKSHEPTDRPSTSGHGGNGSEFSDWHRLLMIRLAPLRHIETELKRRLGAGSEPVTPLTGSPGETMLATPFDNPADYPALGHIRRSTPEFSVRSWREVLDTGARNGEEASGPSLVRRNSATLASAGSREVDSTTLTIAGCKKDMQALWEDRSVRGALKKRKMRLHDSAGFFLNDLERIASRDYVVSDNDIVRARLRTVGVQEYRVRFTHGPYDSARNPTGWEWRIFDVGGCRTSRAAWLPYFDDVNAIIFLSPVSVFDQRLEEDPRVNRLEDSLHLWTSICESKLLAKTQLILFLNKCDLLRRKLKRGIKVKQYLPSYGDRPNEVIPVVKYFREKFKDIQKHHSPEPRSIYIYPTTVTDTEATATTLESVRDGVLRENLANSQLI